MQLSRRTERDLLRKRRNSRMERVLTFVKKGIVKKVEQKKKTYIINPGKITICHDFAGKIFEKRRLFLQPASQITRAAAVLHFSARQWCLQLSDRGPGGGSLIHWLLYRVKTGRCSAAYQVNILCKGGAAFFVWRTMP